MYYGVVRSATAVALWSMLLTPSPAQQDCKGDVCTYVLKGPVHTQQILSQRLPDYARLKPQIFVPSPSTWLVFDRGSNLVEQGINPGPDGAPMTISRQKKDAHGRLIEDEELTGDQKTIYRTEYVLGPSGPAETRVYKNGVVCNRTTAVYDEHGNEIESCVYNAGNTLLSRSMSRYDEQGRNIEWEVHGAGDEFQLHVLDYYDRSGDLAGRDFLSAEGAILMSLAFRQTRLSSLFRDPACEGQGMGFVVNLGDRSTDYQIKDHCRVEITVQEHSGRMDNQENDVTERYDEDWNLLEKLTYQYERDRYGNWITRTVSAWDPTTDALVPIQEDRREITYY
jgi:antitoxin component YwqK of YwqJK toxin-antitoxin module